VEIEANIQSFKVKEPFRFATAVIEATSALVVTVRDDGGHVGRGEAEGVFYTGETAQSLLDEVQAFAASVPATLTRDALREAMPPGGARNAIDCALWDLEAQKAGKTIWQMVEINPRPLTTAFTIGIEAQPEDMAKKARRVRSAPLLKVKLNADRPVERLFLVRQAAPQATLIVDANESWSFAQLEEIAPQLAKLGVKMIEQPLPRGKDQELEGYASPIPLCADESCLHLGELDYAQSLYQMINIKLDKTGGLTEALILARAAKAAGLGLMVGNMMGTSLAMAPSFVVGQLCDFVDLDGPLLLAEDVDHPMRFDDGMIHAPSPDLWG